MEIVYKDETKKKTVGDLSAGDVFKTSENSDVFMKIHPVDTCGNYSVSSSFCVNINTTAICYPTIRNVVNLESNSTEYISPETEVICYKASLNLIKINK